MVFKLAHRAEIERIFDVGMNGGILSENEIDKFKTCNDKPKTVFKFYIFKYFTDSVIYTFSRSAPDGCLGK